jgi:hypothetical protein
LGKKKKEEEGSPAAVAASPPIRSERAKMHSTNLLLEEPIRMVSILEPSKPVSYSPISPRFADLCVRAWIAEP